MSEIELIPTIHGIFTAVAKGDGDGIVPIENSEAGGVGATLDGLLQYPVYITAEMYMPIHHHLSAKVPVEKLAKIFVHTQTHEQCSDQLEKLKVPIIHTSSNAASAVEMQKESTDWCSCTIVCCEDFTTYRLLSSILKTTRITSPGL